MNTVYAYFGSTLICTNGYLSIHLHFHLSIHIVYLLRRGAPILLVWAITENTKLTYYVSLPTIFTLKEHWAEFPDESVALHVTSVSPRIKTSSELCEHTTSGELSALSQTDGSMNRFVALGLPSSVLKILSVQFKVGASPSEKENSLLFKSGNNFEMNWNHHANIYLRNDKQFKYSAYQSWKERELCAAFIMTNFRTWEMAIISPKWALCSVSSTYHTLSDLNCSFGCFR